MRPELILWDWNGTLLDDVELCVDALNRLLEKHAYPQRYDRDQYRAIFGFPIEEYYVRAGFDFSRHSFAMLAEEYMDDYIPASAACPLAEGSIEALDAFRAAVDGTVAEADSLAFRIVESPDGLAQRLDQALRPWLEVVDLSGAADPLAAARAAMEADMARPVDPTRGPLAAERLYRLSAAHHLWYHRAHHLALDGV